MIRVTVLRDSLGIKTQLDTIELFSIPIRCRGDYRCSNHSLVSFDQVRKIADSLSRGAVAGTVNSLEWRKE